MRISTVGPKCGPGWGGYLRPDQFLDHLTVIKTTGNYDIEEIVSLNIARDREGAGIGC